MKVLSETRRRWLLANLITVIKIFIAIKETCEEKWYISS